MGPPSLLPGWEEGHEERKGRGDVKRSPKLSPPDVPEGFLAQ